MIVCAGCGMDPATAVEVAKVVVPGSSFIDANTAYNEGRFDAAAAWGVVGAVDVGITVASLGASAGPKIVGKTIVVAGKEFSTTIHHVIAQQFRNHALLKSLNIDINEAKNLMEAFQRGYNKRHRALDQQARDGLDRINKLLKAGTISSQQAVKQFNDLRSGLRNQVSNDVFSLFRSKTGPNPASSGIGWSLSGWLGSLWGGSTATKAAGSCRGRECE